MWYYSFVIVFDFRKLDKKSPHESQLNQNNNKKDTRTINSLKSVMSPKKVASKTRSIQTFKDGHQGYSCCCLVILLSRCAIGSSIPSTSQSSTSCREA